MASVVILIPARFASSRFPGKPLALIKNKSMIERVFTNCQASGFKTAVVTDNDEIEKHVLAFGGNVIRVDDDVPSGSERIALAYQRFFEQEKAELVINVQGDEPLLKGDVLKELADFHLNSLYAITTLIRERKSSEDDFKNPNVVKAVWSDSSKQCFYFSRQSLPFDRDGGKEFPWYQHIGVYSYRPEALVKFVKLPVSKLEDLEKLEQLRALENGYSIGAILTTQKLIGVDVPDDIKKVEGALL
jgi:3-deoxy-manno-octulosonate cytidylyltransferase (CMP-KDO synthetase)